MLHVHPDALRATGRERAAGLLEEASGTDSGTRHKVASDHEAQAVAYGRAALAKQVLSIFSTEELRHELERREGDEHQQIRSETEAELLAELRADQGQP